MKPSKPIAPSFNEAVLSDLLADPDAQYRRGRFDGFRGMAFLLDECPTPLSAFVRVKALLHFIAPNESVDDLARRCGVSKRSIYRELVRVQMFSAVTEVALDPEQKPNIPE